MSEPTAPTRRSLRGILLRASALFVVLLAVEAGLIAWLLFLDFDRRVLAAQLAQTRALGAQIADRLQSELAPEGVFDQFRVLERKRVVGQVIDDLTSRLAIITHVDVIDTEGRLRFRSWTNSEGFHIDGSAFGGFAPPNPDSPPQLQMPRQPGQRFSFEWPAAARARPPIVVQVPLAQGSGVVELGVSPDPQLEQLRADLIRKLLIGGAISVLLLAVAFLYVLRMIHRTRRLEAEAQQADQLAYLGTLASGLAHEIRNPLNAMNINLQMIEEELEGEGVHQESLGLLTSSRGELQRLERLVKEFLAFARPPRAKRQQLSLEDLVADVVRFVRHQFVERGVELNFDDSTSAPLVCIDSGQIRQALLNILQNALEVSTPGSKVRVQVDTTEHGEASIEIADEGPGIPDHMRGKIFEVFWSQKPAGSGLGLPIAQRVIRTHKGRIELESEEGQGSLFRIVLPPSLPSLDSDEALADEAGLSEQAG